MTAPVLERGAYLVQAVDVAPIDEAEGVLARWRVLHRHTAEMAFVIRIRAHDHSTRLICNCRTPACAHVAAITSAGGDDGPGRAA